MIRVSELHIFPIKSMGGIPLNKADVTDRGLRFDRRWLLVDENNCFITQRDYPRMTFLKPQIENSILQVIEKNNIENKISFDLSEHLAEKSTVTIWDDVVDAYEVNQTVSEWFSDYMGIKCKLVFMPDESKRRVSEDYAHNDEIVSFADGYPFLIIGQSSLDDLNSKLEVPIPMTNFRPNIVFTGGEPFCEDNWHQIKIGELNYYAVKPCARCVITTINQATAEKNNEPLATLSTYRKSGNNILFGENLIHEGTGAIKVGDEIKILSYKNKFNDQKKYINN